MKNKSRKKEHFENMNLARFPDGALSGRTRTRSLYA